MEVVFFFHLFALRLSLVKQLYEIVFEFLHTTLWFHKFKIFYGDNQVWNIKAHITFLVKSVGLHIKIHSRLQNLTIFGNKYKNMKKRQYSTSELRYSEKNIHSNLWFLILV